MRHHTLTALVAVLWLLAAPLCAIAAPAPHLNAYAGSLKGGQPQSVQVTGRNFRSGMRASVGTIQLQNQSAFIWTITPASAATSLQLVVTNVDGKSSNAILVSVVPVAQPPAPADTTPPTIAIASPTNAASYTTSSSALALAGTAADDTTLSSVTGIYAGVPFTVTGAANWSAALTLTAGTFPIVLTAKDAAGNVALASLNVTYTPPPPPPTPSAALTRTPDVTYAPSGYAATLKSPVSGMHFTAGMPLRMFADISDPNVWTCPPGHPPYACTDNIVTFSVAPAAIPQSTTVLGTVGMDPNNYDNWQLVVGAGLTAGDYVLTCTYTPTGGGAPFPCNSPGTRIHIDPAPTHANVVTLAADLVVPTLTWTDTLVNGNGHAITVNGNTTFDNVHLLNVGAFRQTAGIATINRLVHEASGPMTVVGSACTVTNSELRANDREVFVANDPDAGTIADFACGAGTWKGNNVGGGIVRLGGSAAWQMGGPTAAETNVHIGVRSVLSLAGANSHVQGFYNHHTYPTGYSQGFNLITPVGQPVLLEDTVLAEASWTLQNVCGEVKTSVFLDFAQHNTWRTTCSGTKIHHNIWTHYGGHGSGDSGFALFYQGESNVTFENNTVYGGGVYYSPVVQLDGGAGLASFRGNLIVGFTGAGPLLASSSPTTVATAGGNAWWNGAALAYQPGVVVTQTADVTADPQFAQAPDTNFRINEACVWERQAGCSVFDVLAYYRAEFTPTNPAVAGAGASGTVVAGPPPTPTQTPPSGGGTTGGRFLIWYGPKLTALRAKAAAGDADWLSAKKDADALLAYSVPAWTRSGCTANAICWDYQGSGYFGAISSLTFAYAVSLNPAYCAKAIDVVTALNAEAAKGNLEPVSADSYYPTRFVATAIALAYDSCGPLMNAATVSATYATVNAYFDAYKANAFDRDGPATSNYFGGHCLGFGAIGLAMAGENQRGAEIRDYMRTRCDAAIAAAFATGGPFQGGYAVEGATYGINQFVRLLQYLAAIKSATGEDLVTGQGYGQKIVRSLIYNVKPSLWQLSDEADQPGDYVGVMDRTLLVMLTGLMPTTSEGGYAQWLLQNMPAGPFGIAASTRLLWGDAAVAPLDYRVTLPLTARSAGDNHVYARTDWSTSAVWTSYHAGNELFTGHQQKSAGHLAIQRGADYLLVNAGQWKGPDGSGPSIVPSTFDNQACRTNTLNYPTTWTGSYCGGQGAWGSSRIVASSDTAAGTCTTADHTSVYNGTYAVTDLQLFVRTVCTLPTGTSVVIDHVIGSQVKTIAWHLNRNCALTISGNTAICLLGTSKLALWSNHQALLLTADPGDGGTVAQRVDVSDSSVDVTFIHVLQPIAAAAAPMSVSAIAGGVQVGSTRVTVDVNGIPTVN